MNAMRIVYLGKLLPISKEKPATSSPLVYILYANLFLKDVMLRKKIALELIPVRNKWIELHINSQVRFNTSKPKLLCLKAQVVYWSLTE